MFFYFRQLQEQQRQKELERERLERERMERERLERERSERERLERERQEQEQLERERQERERERQDRLERERQERERLERLDRERQERERQEQLERERLERERRVSSTGKTPARCALFLASERGRWAITGCSQVLAYWAPGMLGIKQCGWELGNIPSCRFHVSSLFLSVALCLEPSRKLLEIRILAFFILPTPPQSALKHKCFLGNFL